MSAPNTIEDANDLFDGVVIVVPPEEHPKDQLRRSVPKRRYDVGRSPDLGVPLFMVLGLPAISVVGAVIGYALSVL